jgi:hypothetical protein
MIFLGRGGRPGLAGAAGKGYISPAGRKTHYVGKQYAGHKIAVLGLQDYHRFRRPPL